MTDSILSQPTTTPVFGADGEPCASCRAPLAGDQRYCLYCGARRPQAQPAFLAAVAPAPVPATTDVWQPAPTASGAIYSANTVGPPLPPPAAPHGLSGWSRANGGLIGLAGVLLGALLIGLLIGHWVSGPGTTAQAPSTQVIRLVGAGAGAAASTTPASSDTSGSSGNSTGSSSSGGSRGGSSKSSSSTAVPKGAASVDKLKSLKGQDYNKAVDKLAKKGKPISTGTGPPPAKDNKAPAGGADFETIG